MNVPINPLEEHRLSRRAGFDRLAAKLVASSLDVPAEGPSCDRRTVASDKAARPPK